MIAITYFPLLICLIALAVFSLSILISVLKIGRSGFVEAGRIQGSMVNVFDGRVKAEFDVSNDPRVVEGMTKDPSTGVFIRNNRLSDDYLKSVFGA